jgi:hypothetical protein
LFYIAYKFNVNAKYKVATRLKKKKNEVISILSCMVIPMKYWQSKMGLVVKN